MIPNHCIRFFFQLLIFFQAISVTVKQGGKKIIKKMKINDMVIPLNLGIKDETKTSDDDNKIILEEDGKYRQISRNHAKIYVDADGPIFYFYI